jgi:hypothetical protein
VSWIPLVDYLLYSGSLPFYSEVFDETYPADPLADDPAELFGAGAATGAPRSCA